MGLKLSITVVDTKGNLKFEKSQRDFKSEIVKTEDLSPDDLHVGFYKDKIILLNDKLVEIINENPQLNSLEKEISDKFKSCDIFHLIQFDTIGMAGYVIIENKIKVRAKAVVEGGLYLDDGNLTPYEISVGQTFKQVIFEDYPRVKPKILKNIEGCSPKEELIYLLAFRNKLIKDNITYYNAGLEEEFIHKLIPLFIDSDWFGFCKFNYVKYTGVSYGNRDLKITDYISNAYQKLN